MGKFVSRRAVLGFAKESVRGTPATPVFWIPWSTINFDSKSEITMAAQAHGNIQMDTDGYLVKKRGSGEFEGFISDKALGIILVGVLGGDPTTTGSGNYTHTWSGITNTNQHQSLSAYIKDPNFSEMFPLTMIEKFGFKIAPNATIPFNLSILSRGVRDWADLTPDFTSLGQRFLHQHAQIRLATPGANASATASNLAAASEIKIRNLEFNIEKNLIELDDIGTVQSGDINNQSMKISGTIELTYEDKTYRDIELLETYKAMRIALVYGDNNSLQIDLQRVKFQAWQPNKALEAIATQKLDFVATYDAANGVDAISQVILKNQQASY